MGMFNAGNNDGYYRLGLETVQVIRHALGGSANQSGSTQQAGDPAG